MKPWKIRIAPQFIVIGVLIIHGLILFQNCSSSNMKIDYLEESSASIQGIAEVKFESPKAAYGPSTTELKFSVEKTFSDKIKGYTCQWDGFSPFDCSSKVIIISALPDGDQKLKIKMSYDSGQIEEAYALVRIDRSQPTVSFTVVPNGISNQQSGVINFNANDAISGLKSNYCSLNSTAYVSCVNSFTFNSLPAGDHSLRVRAEDIAGNTFEKVFSWKVDLVVPTASITNGPASLTNMQSASFTFSGVNHNSFECALDTGAFEACTSPKSYTGLLPGDHRFKVRALRNNGNMSSVIEKLWTIDNSVPEVTLTQTPSNPTNSKSARFMFTSDATGDFFCSIDNAAFEACSSPKDYNNLAAGDHSFKVKIKNRAGTESVVNASTTYSWMIDLSVPTVMITTAVKALTNETEASFSFSGTGIVSYKCRLNGGTYSSCSSPKSYSSLAQGNHKFEVIGTNAVGTESAVASFSWTIDLVAPVLTITTQPRAWESFDNVNIAFNSPTGHRYECALDSEAFASCTSPKTYSSLAEGSHTVKVRAYSEAGNASEIKTVSFGIDTAAPVLTLTQKPNDFSNKASENIEFTATGVSVELKCKLNAGNFSSCNSPYVVTTTSEGSYSVSIKAISRSGVESQISSVSWTTDRTAPTAPDLMLDVGEYSQKKNIQASFSSTDSIGVDKYQCSLDAGAYVSCSSPETFANLTEVSHTIAVKAFDKAGNVSAVSSKTVIVDATAPAIAFTSVTPALVAAKSEYSSLSIKFNVTEVGSGLQVVECSVDGKSPSDCSSGIVELKDLALGIHSLTIRAKDKVGFESSASLDWERVEYNPVIEYPGIAANDLIYVAPYLHGIDNGPIYMTSACGVHKVKEGAQGLELEEKNFQVAGVIQSVAEIVSGASSKVFVGTNTGLFQSNDSGFSFSNKLDLAKASSLLSAQSLELYPCATQTMPTLNSFSVRKVTAKGSTVVAQIDDYPGILFVSSNGGSNWAASVFAIEDGYVSIPTSVNSVQIQDNGDILVAANSPIVPGRLTKYKDFQSGNCKTTTPNYYAGVFVSIDGGKRFLALKSQTNNLSSVIKMKSSGPIIGYGQPTGAAGSNLIYKSNDGGASFAGSIPAGLSNASFQNMDLQFSQKFSEVSSGIYLSAFDISYGNQLYRSTDRGSSFSTFEIDGRYSPGKLMYNNHLAISGSKAVFSTSNGLYLTSADGAKIESNLKFKSSYCYFPWWQTGDGGSVYEEDSVIVKSDAYKQIFVSTDGGNNFAKKSYAGFAVFKIFKGAGEDLVYFDQNQGKFSVTTLAATAQPVSLTSDYKDADNKLSYYAPKGKNNYGVYISTDLKNYSSQLEAYYAAKDYQFLGAVSFDKKAIGFNAWAISFFDDGVFKSDLVTLPAGLSFKGYAFIDGNIYVFGDKTYVSDDNGASFKELTGAPAGLTALWKSGTSLKGVVGGSGRLFQSDDGGDTWGFSSAETSKTEF